MSGAIEESEDLLGGEDDGRIDPSGVSDFMRETFREFEASKDDFGNDPAADGSETEPEIESLDDQDDVEDEEHEGYIPEDRGTERQDGFIPDELNFGEDDQRPAEEIAEAESEEDAEIQENKAPEPSGNEGEPPPEPEQASAGGDSADPENDGNTNKGEEKPAKAPYRGGRPLNRFSIKVVLRSFKPVRMKVADARNKAKKIQGQYPDQEVLLLKDEGGGKFLVVDIDRPSDHEGDATKKRARGSSLSGWTFCSYVALLDGKEYPINDSLLMLREQAIYPFQWLARRKAKVSAELYRKGKDGVKRLSSIFNLKTGKKASMGERRAEVLDLDKIKRIVAEAKSASPISDTRKES